MNQHKMRRSKLEYVAYACLVIGFLCIIIFLGIIIIHGKYGIASEINDDSINTSANIGNFIGGIVGPLWSLAGVFLYFSALKLQSQEIANQVNEMSDNKRLLTQQQFETTFFNLLNAQEKIKDNLSDQFNFVIFKDNSLKREKRETKGLNFFNDARIEFMTLYKYCINPTKYGPLNLSDSEEKIKGFSSAEYAQSTNEEIEKCNIQFIEEHYRIKPNLMQMIENAIPKDKIGHIYAIFYHRHVSCLRLYCSSFYNIIKYIDSYEKELAKISPGFNNKNKIEEYVTFATSNLSSSERFILYYEMYYNKNTEELYTKYRIFESFLSTELIDSQHSKHFPAIKLMSSLDLNPDLYTRTLEKLSKI